MKHKFVDFIPDNIENGVIYISLNYNTAIHKCCCGCNNEVVTPLAPTDWKLTYDGKNVSLYPSIGNWSFDCKSHYWIKDGEIQWAQKWDAEKITMNRISDGVIKKKYYNNEKEETPNLKSAKTEKKSWSKRILEFFIS